MAVRRAIVGVVGVGEVEAGEEGVWEEGLGLTVIRYRPVWEEG